MKICSFCGKEYPDDSTVCVVDGQSLNRSVKERNEVSGVWRGAYGFDLADASRVVSFTLKLKQGWLSHFTGMVMDVAPQGMPGTGTIDGYFGFPRVDFTKQMPVCYVAGPDGVAITLRELLAAKGRVFEHDFPHPPIIYEGTFLAEHRVQGSWIIRPTNVKLPDGSYLPMPQSTGIWCAEFVSTDMNATPTNWPKEPFFDKSLFPQPEPPMETESNNGSGLNSMGKFSVGDAEELLKRFEAAGLRFKIERDDTAMREMMPFTAITGGYSGTAPMIEIFIHPDDEAKAVEIMGDDNKV
jgi:hypothetical protein